MITAKQLLQTERNDKMSEDNKQPLEALRPKSSFITEIGYSEDTKTLLVEFKNGKGAFYSDVPREVYEEFIKAPSLGSFLNQYIKGKYEFESF